MPKFEILLVDDLQLDAKIFETALGEASARARVYWVASGEEALDFLYQRGRFEGVGGVKMVILDLHLPGEDGLSVLRAIKSDPSFARMPVLMLSSSHSQPEIDLAYSLGANAYFRKPVSLDSYIELVGVLTRHWLDMAQLPSPFRSQGKVSSEQRDRETESLDI